MVIVTEKKCLMVLVLLSLLMVSSFLIFNVTTFLPSNMVLLQIDSTISNKRYPRRAVPLSNTYGGMCLGVCYPIIPDIQRSSHNPDITLSEIGFVLFGAKNTFAGKKGREEAKRMEEGGHTRTDGADRLRSFVRVTAWESEMPGCKASSD